MSQPKLFIRFSFIVTLVLACYFLQAQDKIYTIYGKVVKAKVSEVGPKQIKYTATDNPNGPLYIMNETEIDSIVYSNGKVDEMVGTGTKRDLAHNIPQLNTWTYDVLGFAFLSVSQSYERRLKNGKIGFRVPLYIGFIGGGIAGVGTFTPGLGVYYPTNNYGRNGSSLATGLNVKCYLFKRRVIRAFAGPEATIGYSSTGNPGSYDPAYGYYRYNNTLITYGTFALLGKVGLSFNPKDKFNITVDGGAGIGDIFGHEKSNPSEVGFTGLWHIGLSMGTNF